MHEKFRAVQRAWKKTLPDSDSLQCIQVEIKTGCTEHHRCTPGSAAYDITAAETIVIKLGTITPLGLNLRLALPPDTVLLLKSRSGITLKGITVEAGVIDSDYSRQIKAIVRNQYQIRKKQRICQGLILKCCKENVIQDDSHEWDTNPHGGFGSTGI